MLIDGIDEARLIKPDNIRASINTNDQPVKTKMTDVETRVSTDRPSSAEAEARCTDVALSFVKALKSQARSTTQLPARLP